MYRCSRGYLQDFGLRRAVPSSPEFSSPVFATPSSRWSVKNVVLPHHEFVMRYVSSGLTDFRLLRRCQRETELGMFMFLISILSGS